MAEFKREIISEAIGQIYAVNILKFANYIAAGSEYEAPFSLQEDLKLFQENDKLSHANFLTIKSGLQEFIYQANDFELFLLKEEFPSLFENYYNQKEINEEIIEVIAKNEADVLKKEYSNDTK